MLTNRQNEIVRYLETNKYAKINDIAEKFFISSATVRRELTELEQIGLVHRDHGGAAIADNAEDVAISVRQILNAERKTAIAALAADRLPEFSTVFIDNSSTAMMLAQRLNFRRKTVVTNGITVAEQLAKENETTVLLLGGRYNYHSGSLTGYQSVKEIEQMHFHLTLCSCTSVNAGGAYESSFEQRDIKRAALLNSRHKILLADESKFNDNSLYRTCGLADFDAIYTDAPEDLVSPLKALPGVTVISSAQD
ncbi:MAG: DeoR/GlpR transcriptional regulator [Clostridia bacterium]|nr:DeoR/GlpR transcriptional regulator [Clostridia bacterium]